MKKKTGAAAFISALLISAVAGTLLINLVRANPIVVNGVTPEACKPPTISIILPANKTTFKENNLSVSLVVRTGNWNIWDLYICDVSYRADWQDNNISVYRTHQPIIINNSYDNGELFDEFSGNLNLTGIPDGERNITVYATEQGWYSNNPTVLTVFNLTASSVVTFTVDTTSPQVSVLSPQNQTLIVASAALFVVIGAGLLVYFKRRSRQTETR